jgi:hypothetical protein
MAHRVGARARHSERTFFVVANSAPGGDLVRVDAPPADAARADSVGLFDTSQFPARLVSFVGLRSRLRDFFEFPECQPRSSVCVSSGVCTG